MAISGKIPYRHQKQVRYAEIDTSIYIRKNLEKLESSSGHYHGNSRPLLDGYFLWSTRYCI